jgi:hypothetical protein
MGTTAHNRGYAWPVSSSASARLHGIQVALPRGDPSGITTAEHFRAAPVGAPTETRALSQRIEDVEAIRTRVFPIGQRVGELVL